MSVGVEVGRIEVCDDLIDVPAGLLEHDGEFGETVVAEGLGAMVGLGVVAVC